MVFNIGDHVKLVQTPAQTGVVLRINVLGSPEGVVVQWNAGPIYSDGQKIAYFGPETSKIEVYTP